MSQRAGRISTSLGTAVRRTRFQGSVPGGCGGLTALEPPNRWAGGWGGKGSPKLGVRGRELVPQS